jgi:hypothetical protein
VLTPEGRTIGKRNSSHMMKSMLGGACFVSCADPKLTLPRAATPALVAVADFRNSLRFTKFLRIWPTATETQLPFHLPIDDCRNRQFIGFEKLEFTVAIDNFFEGAFMELSAGYSVPSGRVEKFRSTVITSLGLSK